MKILAAGAAALAMICLPSLPAQPGPPDSGPPPPGGGEEALQRIAVKIAGGKPLEAADIGDLGNAVIRIEEDTAVSDSGEVDLGESGRRIYVLKVTRRDDEILELMEMQKTLLQSQLTILNSLAAILRHQEHLESRIARNENLVRELEMEMRDAGHGIGQGRLDSASGLVVSRDAAAIGEQTHRELKCDDNQCGR